MQHSDEYLEELVETGDRLPASMCEVGMPEEILTNPVFNGSDIVEDEGK